MALLGRRWLQGAVDREGVALCLHRRCCREACSVVSVERGLFQVEEGS